MKIQMQWVPAHIGIHGNERADQVAKLATGWRDKRGQIQPAPRWERYAQLTSAANRREKELVKSAWQETWTKGNTSERLRNLMPKIDKKILSIYNGILKALCAVIAQARTGKIALKAYLHAINRADDNKCECGEAQTVEHILLTCSKYEKLRQQVWGDRTSRHTSTKTMLTNPKDTHKAAKFLIKTGLLGQFARVRDRIEW